jgi:hypothetical protein
MGNRHTVLLKWETRMPAECGRPKAREGSAQTSLALMSQVLSTLQGHTLVVPAVHHGHGLPLVAPPKLEYLILGHVEANGVRVAATRVATRIMATREIIVDVTSAHLAILTASC